MKKTELLSIRKKDLTELEKNVVEKKSGLAKLIMGMAKGGEKNLKKAKNLRKEIAQILSLIKEKEIMAREEKKQ